MVLRFLATIGQTVGVLGVHAFGDGGFHGHGDQGGPSGCQHTLVLFVWLFGRGVFLGDVLLRFLGRGRLRRGHRDFGEFGFHLAQGVQRLVGPGDLLGHQFGVGLFGIVGVLVDRSQHIQHRSHHAAGLTILLVLDRSGQVRPLDSAGTGADQRGLQAKVLGDAIQRPGFDSGQLGRGVRLVQHARFLRPGANVISAGAKLT